MFNESCIGAIVRAESSNIMFDQVKVTNVISESAGTFLRVENE